MIRISETLI